MPVEEPLIEKVVAKRKHAEREVVETQVIQTTTVVHHEPPPEAREGN